VNQLDFVVSLGLAAGTSEAKVAGAKGFRKMGSAHLPGTCLHLLNILSDILLSSNLETVQLLNNPFNNLVLSNSFSFLFLHSSIYYGNKSSFMFFRYQHFDAQVLCYHTL
jgi:hypothetical protein